MSEPGGGGHFTENVSLYIHLGWREAGRDERRVYMKKNI